MTSDKNSADRLSSSGDCFKVGCLSSGMTGASQTSDTFSIEDAAWLVVKDFTGEPETEDRLE